MKIGAAPSVKPTAKPKYDKKNYGTLLQHPKWQKKRLKIFERDKWRCKKCGSTEKTLHLHHLKYTADLPWLEPSHNLQTLCGDCHKKVHKK